MKIQLRKISLLFLKLSYLRTDLLIPIHPREAEYQQVTQFLIKRAPSLPRRKDVLKMTAENKITACKNKRLATNCKKQWSRYCSKKRAHISNLIIADQMLSWRREINCFLLSTSEILALKWFHYVQYTKAII